MIKLLGFAFALMFSIGVLAQKPKLMVGIVVDQMRYEYLERFSSFYGNDGFKRLMKHGVNFTNHHYNFVPTFTGPGHASIYTGTTPSSHGIIANDWYDKATGRVIYCCTDTSVKTVGSFSGAGQMSSKNLKTNTLGDAFRLSFGLQSKVFGVSLKDRGAILPAGHSANAAFWFDGGKYGNWISSTQYMDNLPDWITRYNASIKKDALLNQTWTANEQLLISDFTDSATWERPFNGKKQAVFPYNLSTLKVLNDNYSLLKAVPMGNDLSADFAKTLIVEEALGTDSIPDFLALSFSATDYIGHYFGSQSLELADAYLRLDKTLASFLDFLDDQVGKGNYLVFLSSDHGAIDPPKYYESFGMPGNLLREKKIGDKINKAIEDEFGVANAIGACMNEQVFLNPACDFLGKKEDVVDFIIAQLNAKEGIIFATRYHEMHKNMSVDLIPAIQKGYYPGISGEIVFALSPGWSDYGNQGSNHGTAYQYDTHVPFLIFGSGVGAKEIYQASAVNDIAPTIGSLMGVVMPWSCTGRNLRYLLD